MSMTKCRKCGGGVSTTAKHCPACGATQRRTNLIAYSAITVVALLTVSHYLPPPAPAPAPLQTTPEKPRKPQPNAEQEAANEKGARAAAVTLIVARTLVEHLHDPAYIQWKQILANDDASLICMTYRARNAMGGLVITRTAFHDRLFHDTPEAWNAHCAGKPLNDLTHLRDAI